MDRSIVNEMLSNIRVESIRPGTGVTELLYTDRSAFTVVEILGPKRIRIRRDRVTEWKDHYGIKFENGGGGAEYTLSLRRNGRWMQVGYPQTSPVRWAVGVREEYRDPHF